MLERSVLEGLLARVREAKGPDRELDEAIMAAIYQRDERYIGAHDADTDERLTDQVWVDPATDKWVCTHAFRFTEEQAYGERLVTHLPGGWQITVMTPDPTRPGHAGRAWAKISPYQTNDDGWKIGARDGTAPTAPLALTQVALMALLALSQGETREGVEP